MARRLAKQGDGTVDGDLLQALVGQAQLMATELLVNVVAHYLQRLAGAEGGQQALERMLVQQLLAEQLGEAGADRHLASRNAHPHSGFAVDGEPKVGEPLPHLRHVPLQSRPAEIPGVRQLVEFDPPVPPSAARPEVQHPLAAGVRGRGLSCPWAASSASNSP